MENNNTNEKKPVSTSEIVWNILIAVVLVATLGLPGLVCWGLIAGACWLLRKIPGLHWF